MRITKVKAGNRMVTFHRTTEKGKLVRTEEKRDETSVILPKEIIDNFKRSILGQTINKRAVRNPKKDKDKAEKLKNLEYALSNLLFGRRVQRLGSIDRKDLESFVKEKFHKDISYVYNNRDVVFNLIEDLMEYSQTNDINKLNGYKNWVTVSIDNRSRHLTKSIRNNKISFEAGRISPRKQALNQLEKDYLRNNGSLENSQTLKEAKKEYNIRGYVEIALSDLARYIGKEIRANELNLRFKNKLKQHQRNVFGTSDNPKNRNNLILNLYNYEFVKYLERNFPIKRRPHNHSDNDIKYYIRPKNIEKTIRLQIENAIRSNIIQKGKLDLHTQGRIHNKISSDVLIGIKRTEGLLYSMIDASAFAALNIKNIINRYEAGDILDQKTVIDSIEKNNVNKTLFKEFFGYDYSEDTEALIAIRGAVQMLRNNFTHYTPQSLVRSFSIEKYNRLAGDSNSHNQFNNTIFKSYLEDDLEKVPELIANQLMSGGVLTYYSMDTIKSILKKIEFSLARSSTPFTPGFKKVFRAGTNYKKFGEDHYLRVKNYLPKGDIDQENEEEFQARYFLAKLLYNNIFLKSFNDKDFRNKVSFVLNENKKQAEGSRNEDKFAFKDIRHIKEEETVIEYLSYVQSQLNIERTKKLEKEKKTNLEQRNNFQKFLLDVYVKGFDDFLNKFEEEKINSTEYQLDTSLSNNDRAKALLEKKQEITQYCKISSNLIKTNDSNHISFYIFTKLLDSSHISTLRNEFIKYRQASLEDSNRGLRGKQNILEITHLLEILDLSLLLVDVDKNDSIEDVLPFIEEGKELINFGDLYVQLDRKTRVSHSGIEMISKYGSKRRMRDLMNIHPEFKIKVEDYQKWMEYKESYDGDSQRSNIETLIKKREELHKSWVNKEYRAIQGRGKDAKLSNKAMEYQKIAREIDEYNWLDNKLTFVHLKNLHNLLIEILGRYARYTSIEDRDHEYFYISNKINTGDRYKRWKPATKSFFLDFETNDEGKSIKYKTRNRIAHFNYLTIKKLEKSIIDLLNDLRDLMSYDRKLKNAVSKSLIGIFAKNGMELKLEFDKTKHILRVKSLEPMQIYHLGTKRPPLAVTTNRVSKEYCEICKALLEMGSKEEE